MTVIFSFVNIAGRKFKTRQEKRFVFKTEHTFRFVNQNKLERERMENEERNKAMSK